MHKIMIAVDGSELSLDAVHHVLALLAAGLRAQLLLAHVQEPASLLELATQDSDAIATAAVQAGQHLLAPALALLQGAGVACETEIALGQPAATLIDMAEENGADLLVLGARGLGGLRGALVGSVSQEVVQHSPVPVTIVRHAAQAEAEQDERV